MPWQAVHHSDDAHLMSTFYKLAVVHYNNLTYCSTQYTARGVSLLTRADSWCHFTSFTSRTRHRDISRELVGRCKLILGPLHTRKEGSSEIYSSTSGTVRRMRASIRQKALQYAVASATATASGTEESIKLRLANYGCRRMVLEEVGHARVGEEPEPMPRHIREI